MEQSRKPDSSQSSATKCPHISVNEDISWVTEWQRFYRSAKLRDIRKISGRALAALQEHSYWRPVTAKDYHGAAWLWGVRLIGAGVDVLLTTDDALVRRAKRNENELRVRVENFLTWLAEVLG